MLLRQNHQLFGLAGCALRAIASFDGIQSLSHEVMLVSGGMILKRPKDAIFEFFVEGSRLKTEGVKECIGAALLNRIKFRTLHQFPAKSMPSRRRYTARKALLGIKSFFTTSFDEAESIKTIQRAVDAGTNLIDTAPVYGFGHSEEIIGKALAKRRAP